MTLLPVASAGVQQQWEPVYVTVQPYRGFDHFQAYPDSECDAFAIGIGLFSSLSGVTERNSLVLRREEKDRFATEALPFGGDVITHRVVQALSQTWVVALVRKGDETFFEVVRLQDCARATTNVLSTAMPLKVDQVIAPRPNNTTFIGPPLEGTTLLTVSTRDSEAEFVVYDGRTVQAFKVDFSLPSVSERDWVIR